MNKEIANIGAKFLQRHKLRLLFLLGILLINMLLPAFFPFLKNIGLASPAILKVSAHILLSLILLFSCLIFEWANGKQSDSRCPYCGSFKWFLIKSKTEGVKNLPKQFIQRIYKCKDCEREEKIIVAPLQLNYSPSD